MLKKISCLLLIVFCLLTTGCNNDLKIIDSIEDLSKSKIGVYTGSEYDTLLKEKISDAKPAYYNSYSDEISALKSGKIDAFLTDEPLAKEKTSSINFLYSLFKLLNSLGVPITLFFSSKTVDWDLAFISWKILCISNTVIKSWDIISILDVLHPL